ncbi:hypothetical protein ACP4OV_007821 [Aristida adscensionis]
MGSVENCVILTTVLVAVRFSLDLFFPRLIARSGLAFVVMATELLSYSLVHYTLGLMQLSAARVNDYFQVWAVLLLTLQYSASVGRPYGKSMHIPLLHLMSSLWTANLIRVQTLQLLQIPLWLIWALNTARIISYFSSSEKAPAISHGSMKLIGDYMSYEHTLGVGDSQFSFDDVADPAKQFSMKQYKYIVHGEAQIWDVDGGESRLLGAMGDPSNKLKDVCLSFALYKLLRCRFYDLPMHEARLPSQKEKMRRLVFQYILHDAESAFRVVDTEISFLQDMFYSKHAAMFSAGFRFQNLVLSLLLVAATGYIIHPVSYIPEMMDKADRNRITHWVFITYLIVALIIVKEVAEIHLYVFSQWTKVVILRNYAKHRCLRNPIVEKALWMVLSFGRTRPSWQLEIDRYNLLQMVLIEAPTRSKLTRLLTGGYRLGIYKLCSGAVLQSGTWKAIIESIKRLENNPERLGSYFSNAFGAPGQPVHDRLLWAVDKLEIDTHRILVWHIATFICQILTVHADECQPYQTAVVLSQYCAYLVTQALMPDNDLVVLEVFNEVYKELEHRTLDYIKDELCKHQTAEKEGQGSHGVLDEEAQIMPKPQKELQEENGNNLELRKSLVSKGFYLGLELSKTFRNDSVDLWEKLAVFWTEFLLQLSASTKASMHRMRLAAGKRELTTILWALLAHAGFLSTCSSTQQRQENKRREGEPKHIRA